MSSCRDVGIFTAKSVHVFFVGRSTNFRTAFTNDARHLKVLHGRNLSICLIRRCCSCTRTQNGSVWLRTAQYGSQGPGSPVPAGTPDKRGTT